TKVRLLKHLSAGPKTPGPPGTVAAPQGPPQAYQFISLLLEEYSALCQAARTISSFLLTLENEHLKKFQVTWELHNKHLFENLVFSEPILHSSLPTLVAQLKHGTVSHDSYNEDTYRSLLESYQQLQQEMASVAAQWQECEKRIDDYVDEQTSKSKQRMLKEDWEFFKQRKFIEEQVTNNKKNPSGDNNFTNTMRMLSSRLSIPDCPNCNYRRRCTCDDCSLSHILTCGIMDSPITEDLHIKLPLQGDAPRDYIAEVHPTSLSSGSSASGSNSSSPITVQQHPRLILPEGHTNTFISDDDEVPPLSSKFGDVYPLSAYEGAAVNGLHNDINRDAENVAVKEGSPHITSSSSSSEGDEEEADGGAGRGMRGQQLEVSSGKNSSPLPSYNHQQVEQVQHACECHVCNQDPSCTNLGSTTCLPPSRLHTAPPPTVGHQFFTDSKTPPTHPALHLYPHIHGHLPLHNFSRPLPHHCKSMLPRTALVAQQQQVTGTVSLQCLSLKFENLWDAAVMKSWNPSVLLPESLPAGDMLGPPLADMPLPPTSSASHQGEHSLLPTSSKEQKKSGAKKKCLYNFQDAFLETNRVVMATSASTSSVSCTATTVQSSNNPLVLLRAQDLPSFHFFSRSLGKEDHRQPPPGAPRSQPGMTSLPPLSGPTLPPAPTKHLPTMGSQPFPKMAAPAPDFMEAHQGLCLPPAEPPSSSVEGPISAPPSVCSDPDCEGHRCETNAAYDQPYDGEESQDEDSCEHSSSTSTSTNQKEGKYCDCCYCEFFGHGGPPAAPTSRNYAEMREKLRLRLTKRKEEQPKREEHQSILERDGGVEDHRRVEDLLQFINSADNKPSSSSKAAKRARHKQKKLEEKARLEAEAREREEQQLLEEQQRRQRQEEEEAALQKELLRLQELQQPRAAKKKKKEKAKENTAPPQNNPQPLKQTAQNVLDNLQNPSTLQSSGKGFSSQTVSSVTLHSNTPSCQLETNGKVKAKPSSKVTSCEAAAKKEPELPKCSDVTVRLANGTGPSTATDTKASRIRPAEAPAPVPATDSRKDDRNTIRSTSGKREQQQQQQPPPPPLAQTKEERRSPPVSNPSPPPPPSSQCEQPQQNGKPPSPESPQPKGKNKKNKKKKGDKINSSIGWCCNCCNHFNLMVWINDHVCMLSRSDDVFLPKDIDLDSTEMDETEREVEYFKRFCLDSARQTRQRLSINWSNFSLKKATFAAH
uniref:Family with sequence similarity 193 member A n=1 Tax=Tetraodon nigroviridis TaxID=99883 RepID=H3C5P1_TETNG